MAFLLLTGAGFTRNWGGFLGDEAFYFLLGDSSLDADTRSQLWTDKNAGKGFEHTLARMRVEAAKDGTGTAQGRFNYLNGAVARMFSEMDAGLKTRQFEFSNATHYCVSTFLAKFDAIFTVNQDVHLERNYFPQAVTARFPPGGGAFCPGVAPMSGWQQGGTADAAAALMQPTPDRHLSPHSQPYFKLHGSSNWVDEKGGPLLIVGGEKKDAIKASPLLDWNMQRFWEMLLKPDTRLMVIGYSFGDDHINDMIMAACTSGLQVFIIDTDGTDVLDKRDKRQLLGNGPTDLMTVLQPRIIGASQRLLSEIFGGDHVEHAKVMRFYKRS